MRLTLRFLSVALLALFSSVITAVAADVGLRIRFGLADHLPKSWDGHVSVSPGSVERVDGWRFQLLDQITGTDGWKASTRSLSVRRSNNPNRVAKAKGKGGGPLMADNGVFVMLHDVTDQSIVKVATRQGDFEFRLTEIPYGKVAERLGGGVDIERVAVTRRLTTDRDDDDFPALAVGSDGTTYVAWIAFSPGLDRDERARPWKERPADFSFLAKPPGGDRLWLRVQTAGAWAAPIPVTPGGGDLFKCSVAIDGKGIPWIFWSENKAYPGPLADFDVFAASLTDGKLSEPINLSHIPGSDLAPVACTDAAGRLWVAWQADRASGFKIVERHQTQDGSWSSEQTVSTQSGNCWDPAIAASASGRVAIAWDTYDKGDYDVWVREFSPGGAAAEVRAVANTPDYEARPTAVYDRQNRLWLAWEQSGPTWGKEWGALVKKGIPLYRDRQIGMRVLADGQWMSPQKSVATALPGAVTRRGPKSLPARQPEGEVMNRAADAEAATDAGNLTYNNIARLACDVSGRIWLFARCREGSFHTPVGSVWTDYAACYSGGAWTGPVILPHSDDLIYNFPAVAAHPAGGIVIAHSSDHRQDRHINRIGGGNDTLNSDRDPWDNDIFVSRLEMPTTPVELTLVPAHHLPDSNPVPSEDTVAERAAVARARSQVIDYNGTPLHLARGDMHRHTEISGDGGNDGPLEDMWRYAIDVAAMDWTANTDHDNGGGREYTWWLTQKTVDAYRLPGRFDPVFSYERSVPYPEGHRNVLFAQRGVRTLPRLPKTMAQPVVHAPDTAMLYDYLRAFHGICAPHTSATDMGTDWRDHAPDVEPLVEIYQGCRQSYERPSAPRSPTEDDAIGGWRPKGFINLALLKGYRFSFESSSDHVSTHISFTLVYAKDSSREALLDAIRARHVYGATTDIVADYRCKAGDKDYMLGDEFTTDQAPTLRLKLTGSAPFKKVTLVKDDVEIYSTTPNQRDVEIQWTDPAPQAGKTSYYYWRGEQTDEELVWVSPMWITYAPRP
jgi:hypothetical protein